MLNFDINTLKTPDFIKRCENNPVITSDMVPYESVLTYNAGFTKFSYGAADSCECLAACDIGDLLKFVKNEL